MKPDDDVNEMCSLTTTQRMREEKSLGFGFKWGNERVDALNWFHPFDLSTFTLSTRLQTSLHLNTNKQGTNTQFWQIMMSKYSNHQKRIKTSLKYSTSDHLKILNIGFPLSLDQVCAPKKAETTRGPNAVPNWWWLVLQNKSLPICMQMNRSVLLGIHFQCVLCGLGPLFGGRGDGHFPSVFTCKVTYRTRVGAFCHSPTN